MNGDTLEPSAAGDGGGPLPTQIETTGETKSGATRSLRSALLSGRGQLAAAALFLLAIVAAGVVLARRQLDGRADAPEPPASVDLDEPSPPPAAAENAGSPLAGETPARKIFNSTGEGLKAGAETIERLAPRSAEGAISELPPPPAESSVNQSLQNAAKDAGKMFEREGAAPAEIDLSSPDAAAALEKLETEPEAGASKNKTADADVASLSIEVSRLSRELANERQYAESQTAEVARLSAELDAIQAKGAPVSRMVRAALLLLAISEKAASGAPFKSELDAIEDLAGLAPDPALLEFAEFGLPTLATLNETFPAMRDEALAASRRAGATGLASRFAANMASLVRLRRAAPAEGPNPAAILARAEERISAGDIAGALQHLDALTGDAAVAAADWRRKAKAVVAVQSALADMRTRLAAELEGGRSQG